MNKNKINRNKIGLCLALASGALMFYLFDLGQYLDLGYLQSKQQLFADYYRSSPAQTIAAFMLIYVVATTFSFPGAALLTLLAGAIFGLLAGTVIVSFASTVGATLAFLLSRTLLRDSIERRFAQQIKAIDEGVEKDGAFYLFTLRLVPLFPFFVVNSLMGLTSIRTLTYFWVSQLGMLAGTIVYVNAGTEMAKLDSLSGILSAPLLMSFALLGLFPLLSKFLGTKFVNAVRANRALKRFRKPKQFDANMIVIGAGAAGLVSSYIGSVTKAKVVLIEKDKMGGDCLNTGCVPSKAILRTAKIKSYIDRADAFGLSNASVEVEFKKVMQRVRRVVEKIAPHDSIARYSELGVECVVGEARLTSPWTVEVDGRQISARNIVVATGARPFVPPIPGLELVDYLTSDNVWKLEQLPARMIVLGGGPIGCELSQAFARLGAKVTQVEQMPRLMMREDDEVSDYIKHKFTADGIDVRLLCRAEAIHVRDGEKFLVCKTGAVIEEIPFDEILISVGRAANTQGFGLRDLGVKTTERGTIEVDEYLQTNIPTVYACGDVAGPYQFTHTAAHQAWYVAVNSLFGRFKKFKVDYSVIPWATFTDPEVARVGLNEADAKQRDIAYEVTRFEIDDLDRAIADEEDHGFIKVLTVPGKDRILGVTIVGHHAGDNIAEYVQAMKQGIGLNKILSTIHIYPTLTEANKYVAGEWKRARTPERLLAWVEKYHAWMRRDKSTSGEVIAQPLEQSNV
ncbi:MAG: FAD-dependent oxidoreductase [Pseudomonadales bacterium]|nr:FAD-dependent oxidoreductase [Pseudomonadales bacterium]